MTFRSWYALERNAWIYVHIRWGDESSGVFSPHVMWACVWQSIPEAAAGRPNAYQVGAFWSIQANGATHSISLRFAAIVLFYLDPWCKTMPACKVLPHCALFSLFFFSLPYLSCYPPLSLFDISSYFSPSACTYENFLTDDDSIRARLSIGLSDQF